MNRSKLMLASVVLLFGCVAQANASIIVDQQQLSSSAYMAGFGQTDLAQSFQQSLGNITGAAIGLENSNSAPGTGDITISLYDALPNAGGHLLASGTAFGVTAGAQGQLVSVNFGGPIPITPNTTYFLVFTSTNSSMGLAGDVSNPYPLGNVYANPGYQSFTGFDYTFQTFADDSTAAAVPEPASLVAFIVLALGGGFYSMRRRTAA
ncbi:MAG TPA: PEP-CTERM sorting domain-containing protein [Gemmataceae bacterium]|nr:PEP-CTERM sorting domain-containing protein [Gemmataceae bacterium]